MIIQIVIEGKFKNKVIEKDVTENTLVSTITFINQHGLYESDRWIPPYRIKEIKFDSMVSKKQSRISFEPEELDDRLLPESK